MISYSKYQPSRALSPMMTITTFNSRFFPLQILPFFDLGDLVLLLKNMTDTFLNRTAIIPNVVHDDMIPQQELCLEAAKYLTWKADGLSDDITHKLVMHFPKVKD